MAFIRSFIQEGAKFKNVWARREIVHGIYRTVAIAIARETPTSSLPTVASPRGDVTGRPWGAHDSAFET